MKRRNFLVKLIQLATAGVVALLPMSAKSLPPRQAEYEWWDIDRAAEFASVLQQAVYDKRIRYYTCSFRNNIIIRWAE